MTKDGQEFIRQPIAKKASRQLIHLMIKSWGQNELTGFGSTSEFMKDIKGKSGHGLYGIDTYI